MKPLLRVFIVMASSVIVHAADADHLVKRLHEYLARSESDLSAVVAEETYTQIATRWVIGDGYPNSMRKKRVLKSDVILIRLPGGGPWLGFREIREVDGSPISNSAERLTDILIDPTIEAVERARRLAFESARLNLGDPRTINMPTLPLELLHPRHLGRFRFSAAGRRQFTVTCDGLRFQERQTPTLVRSPQGHNVRTEGIAWVDARTGEPYRVEVTLKPEADKVSEKFDQSRLVVDFHRHPEFGLMLPYRMTETFSVGRSVGQGTATYGNYRRFQTAARLKP